MVCIHMMVYNWRMIYIRKVNLLFNTCANDTCRFARCTLHAMSSCGRVRVIFRESESARQTFVYPPLMYSTNRWLLRSARPNLRASSSKCSIYVTRGTRLVTSLNVARGTKMAYRIVAIKSRVLNEFWRPDGRHEHLKHVMGTSGRHTFRLLVRGFRVAKESVS